MNRFHVPTLLFLLFLATASRSFALSQEERLAGYGSGAPLGMFRAGIGLGTGDLYGGVFGGAVEFGLKDVVLFGAFGIDQAYQQVAYTDGRFDTTTATMKSGKVPGMEANWRVGLKGYIAGEGQKFRPYLAAMFGPLMVYKDNYNGFLHQGKFLSGGLSAGCDWNPSGTGRGFSLTLGVDAFVLTHSITGDEDALTTFLNDDQDMPFLYPRVVAGAGYRF